jgi:DNA-binding NarL/FixJ family response regulator
MGFALSMVGFGSLQDPTPVEESLVLSRELGDAQGAARALILLGWIDLERDDVRAAAARFGEALELSSLLRHPYLIAYTLEASAALAEARGQARRCIRLAAAAAAVRERSRVTAAAVLRNRLEQAVERAGEALSATEDETARREGHSLSDELMLTEARSVTGAPRPARVGAVTLTPREVEVLRLVAEGLTDAAIAERLYVSVRTVNAHLRSVYTKLGVTSRAAATRIASSESLL